MRKAFVSLIVILGVFIFFTSNSSAWEYLNFKTPSADKEVINSDSIEVVVEFEEDADYTTFSAKLNGKDITEYFSVNEIGANASLTRDIGLKVYDGDNEAALNGLGRNILKTKIEGVKNRADVKQIILYIQAPPQKIVKGVAAAGAPIIGNVYIKDSSSPEPHMVGPQQINIDGSFEIDVTGLMFPIYLKAEGSVVAQSFELYSVVTDSGGLSTLTANINPLTNLVLSVATGQNNPAAAFNDPLSYPLTKPEVDNAVAGIQTFIAPLMEAYGYSGYDFIVDTYVANHQGLDGLFDVVDIEIIADEGTVVITDKVNGALIGESSVLNIANPSDIIEPDEAEASQGVPHDLLAIEAMLNQYITTINEKLNSVGYIGPYDISSFFANDYGFNDSRDLELTLEYTSKGFNKFFQEGIKLLNYSNLYIEGTTDNGDYIISYTLNFADGSRQLTIESIFTNNEGPWKFKGNGYWGCTIYPISWKCVWIDNTIEIVSGLYIRIPTSPLLTNLIAVVTGPGLPNDGIQLVPNLQEKMCGFNFTYLLFSLADQNSKSPFIYALSDDQLAEIPDNAEYTIKFYYGGSLLENKTRIIKILKAPVAKTKLVAGESEGNSYFPEYEIDGDFCSYNLDNVHNTLFDNFGGTTSFSYTIPANPEIITCWSRAEHIFVQDNYRAFFYTTLLLTSSAETKTSVNSDRSSLPDGHHGGSTFQISTLDQYGRAFLNSWVYSAYGEFLPITEIPVAAITIDGVSNDWESIAPIVTDPEDDSLCEPGTDITSVYIAVDNRDNPSELYFRIDTKSGEYKPAYNESCGFKIVIGQDENMLKLIPLQIGTIAEGKMEYSELNGDYFNLLSAIYIDPFLFPMNPPLCDSIH